MKALNLLLKKVIMFIVSQAHLGKKTKQEINSMGRC